jgi:hypothetical protein
VVGAGLLASDDEFIVSPLVNPKALIEENVVYPAATGDCSELSANNERYETPEGTLG